MKWRISYCKYRIKILFNKRRNKQLMECYNRMAKESLAMKDSWSNRLDYLIAWNLFGSEPEDYFSFSFFNHRNPIFRSHHVTRTRLNFIKYKFNDDAAFKFLNSKEMFNEYYSEFMGREWCNPKKVSKSEFVHKFSQSRSGFVFVKPLSGSGGKGAYVEACDNTILESLYDRLHLDMNEWIVEEYYSQIGFFHDVNPSSLNTIRITTVRAKDNIIPLYSYFRAGGKDSVVDNVHSGGVKYNIDIRNGCLREGRSYINNSIIEHPSTGKKVAGELIENWNKVVSFAIELHSKAPEGANLIGWDICVSNGSMIVIEANASPGFNAEIDCKYNTWKKVKTFLDLQ